MDHCLAETETSVRFVFVVLASAGLASLAFASVRVVLATGVSVRVVLITCVSPRVVFGIGASVRVVLATGAGVSDAAVFEVVSSFASFTVSACNAFLLYQMKQRKEKLTLTSFSEASRPFSVGVSL